MAQLDVQPKKSGAWWIWLLLAIFAIVILLFLLKGCGGKTTQVVSKDSTNTTTVAVTQPDWNHIDFNSPAATDADITDKDIAVTGTDKYRIYTLGENILFGTDQHSLQSAADAKLQQIVASLNKSFAGAPIAIYGNTDSTGTGEHNAELGGWRAKAVKHWLVTNGIDSTKISLHTFGESKPVASNATAGGRQQNRNVQIVAFPDSK